MQKLILSIAVVFVTFAGFGQSSFGLKGGANLSTTTGFITENSYIVAPHFGIFATIPFSKKVFFRPELLYSVKGYSFPAIDSFYNKGRLIFSYLTVPLLVGFKPADKLLIMAGPEVGYLLNAKYHFENITLDRSTWFNKVDWSVLVGSVYSVSEHVLIELRYNYGFKDLANIIYTDQNGNYSGKDKIGAHRVFQVSINYLLPIRHH
jgi:hypothetical protein